jgi:hypothetical protein
MTDILDGATRTMENLYRAWTIVRSNVLASGREEFKTQVREISENPLPLLRRIQDQLRRRTFQFLPQHGFLKARRGKKPRPIVVSPIENRIVQRALLNILQSDHPRLAAYLGEIPTILRTPTSVGGVPERGVPEAMTLIRSAIGQKATHYLRSDIREFFTTVRPASVVQLVREQTMDDRFVTLLGAAMTVELQNPEEVKEFLDLFPTNDVGVPQGSSLSAFAGNVVLNQFDQQFNAQNIVTIRYIDDFVILGPSGRHVRAAFRSAQKLLKCLGMTAYGPDENSAKATTGEIQEGFEFLGCIIKGSSIGPSRGARRALLDEIDKTFRKGLLAINSMLEAGTTRRAEDAYAQTLVQVDRKVRGWGDAFAFADNRLPFREVDTSINTRLAEFVARAHRAIGTDNTDRKRRAMGIALLTDTPVRRSSS